MCEMIDAGRGNAGKTIQSGNILKSNVFGIPLPPGSLIIIIC